MRLDREGVGVDDLRTNEIKAQVIDFRDLGVWCVNFVLLMIQDRRYQSIPTMEEEVGSAEPRHRAGTALTMYLKT